MNAPSITYETVELRCLCGELTLCVARGPVKLAEFIREAIDQGWRRIKHEQVEVATFWDGEVQIRLYADCPECVRREVVRNLKRAA